MSKYNANERRWAHEQEDRLGGMEEMIDAIKAIIRTAKDNGFEDKIDIDSLEQACGEIESEKEEIEEILSEEWKEEEAFEREASYHW